MSLARVIFHVQDPSARPIAGALLDATSNQGNWRAVTDAAGDFDTGKPPGSGLSPGHYDIKISAAGFQTRVLPADLANPGTITIGLEFAAGSLLAVRAGARDFATSDGRRHVIVGSTELMLAWRFDREGAEGIRPVLMQRQLCGFNNLRVLWQKGPGSNGLTAPWQMPTTKLRPFLALCAEYGFYVQGVILADCPSINPNEADQQARVQAVRSATVGLTNHIEQLGNEYEKNGHDPRHFTKPDDRMASNSSSVEGGKDAPYWDFFCFSGQRSPLNHAIREYGPLEFIYGEGVPGWGGVPAICDEGFKPGAGSVDPRDWERAGAQARSGCGGRFHSDAGTAGNCRPFNDLELDCARAFVKGIGSL